MLIAHLPVGILSASLVEHRRQRPLHRSEWVAFLMGSVLPDVDMVLFLLQGGHTHHHDFLTHRPLFWLVLLSACSGLHWLTRRRETTSAEFPSPKPTWAWLGILVCVQAMLHLFLDTFQGQIAWGWPIASAGPPWIHVERVVGQHWILTFLKHPFFLVEVAFAAAGVWVFMTRHFKRQAR